jgi:hypothetical protein
LAIFCPFLAYATACVVYFTLHAARQQESAIQGSLIPQGNVEFISKMLVYSLTIYMFAFEIFQIIDKKWGYFKQLSNLVKQTSYVLVLVMLIKNEWFIDTFYDIPRDLMLTAIVIALTWYKLFYWMKLFNTTAFFMNVFTKTFEDSNFQAFFIMTVIMILSFANIIYILNIDRGPTYLYADE